MGRLIFLSYMSEQDRERKDNYKRQINRRVNILILIICLAFLVIVSRLFYIQIIEGKKWRATGEQQYFRDIGENFDRGSIYFSNKSGVPTPAVEMFNEYDLAIDPKTLNSDFQVQIEKSQGEETLPDLRAKLFDTLNEVFQKHNQSLLPENSSSSLDKSSPLESDTFLEKESFLAKLSKEDTSYEILLTKIDEGLAEDLRALHIRGLIVNTKQSRLYYEKGLAAKVLGFVGFSGSRKIGLYGLERYYNDILEKSSVSNSNFFAEVFAELNSSLEDLKKNNSLNKTKLEGDLYLTLDINVERYLQSLLQTAKTKWQSEKIGGIVMDINDGSILAMDELPTFNPNDYSEVKDLSLYKNDLISGVYEMGSIIKPLTVAAALDSNTVDESTTYYDAGTISLDGYKISNYDKVARGPNTPLQQILSQSLNVGIAFLVEKMGTQKLSDYFHKFGLGEYTGIDLPGEEEGLVNNLDSHIMVDSVTAGFGQGMAVTPIQTIRALATLGNGGRLVTPHLVKSIHYDNGDVKNIVTEQGEEVFAKASTSQRISQILIKVVDEAMHEKNPKYTVAAKTGTAQMVNSETGKYYEDRYLHSFFGYFPATNPKYIIFLYQVYPKGALYASQTLKDTFFNLVNYLITYAEIKPDR